MKKIGIIGAFGFKTMDMGGQPVKTRNLKATLEKYYGHKNVVCVETYRWKKKPVFMLFSLLKLLVLCDRIIMLPANNGIFYFSKILVLMKRWGAKKIYYDVIGGWLVDLLLKNGSLRNALKKFDQIYVETESMQIRLKNMGFQNIVVLKNYKLLEQLSCNELKYRWEVPYPVCVFSRINAQKGIEDAINAIIEINNRNKKIIYTLDIYGPVDPGYKKIFDDLKNKFPPYITYKGMVNAQDSVKVVKNYFLLLFPTHFYTEGVPGTIIDAYAAGVPVVASKWESHADVVREDITGFCYEFGNFEAFKNILQKVINDPQKIVEMKQNCLNEYQKYTENEFIRKFGETFK